MHFLLLSKFPVNKPPNRAPMERAARLQGLFYMSLIFLIKISLNKEIFPLSQRPYERSVPPCSPKVGPLWKQRPFPEPHSLLHSSFKVPSIWAPFQVRQQGIQALCRMFYHLSLCDIQIIVNYVDHMGQALSCGIMVQPVNLPLTFFLDLGMQLLKCMKWHLVFVLMWFEAQKKGSLDVPLVLCGQVQHLVCHL